LFEGLEGVSELLQVGQVRPDFDYYTSLLSLPLAFKTTLATVPNSIPYLTTTPEKQKLWGERLGAKTKPRIGLVWSGSTGHKNDHNRSFRLDALTQHLSDRFEYVCLQKELREVDRVALEKSEIKNFGAELNDFTDTAALCELMDVVISVDTSVAHLAGALGKPVLLLLPFVPDWRWMLESVYSPWYPTMRILRQKSTKIWPISDSVVAKNMEIVKEIK
jgi:ADP-heptose:LPS heptosyltransferase